MSTNDKILNEMKRVARSLFPAHNASVLLYGSRARGDAKPSSDWDLLIIIDDLIATDDDFSNYAFPFAEIGWYYDAQITPLIYTKKQWEAEANTAFYQAIASEAINL